MNKNKSWSKLSKASKLKKLMVYASYYCKKHKCDNSEEKKLKTFLQEALDRRKLQKIKDVIYDIEKGVIKEINIILNLEKYNTFKKN